MIVRFVSNKTGRYADIDDERKWTAAILQLCGGGYTEHQTAMAMQSVAEIRRGGHVKLGDFSMMRPPYDPKAQTL